MKIQSEHLIKGLVPLFRCATCDYANEADVETGNKDITSKTIRRSCFSFNLGKDRYVSLKEVVLIPSNGRKGENVCILMLDKNSMLLEWP